MLHGPQQSRQPHQAGWQVAFRKQKCVCETKRKQNFRRSNAGESLADARVADHVHLQF
jgi:hypothetical protein